MTNFLLTVIIVILLCLLFGTGVVLGTITAGVLLFVIGMIFIKCLAYINRCLG